MKRAFTILLIFLIIFSSAFVLSPRARADAGDYSADFDFGGDDYGGYDGNDYDSDSSGGGIDLIWLFTFLFRDSPAIGALVVVAAIVLIVLYVKKKKNTGAVPLVRNAGADPTPADSLNGMQSYYSEDPSFSEQDMKEWVSNAYVRLQNAWQAKDLSPVRPLMSDALFAQFDSQLGAYRRGHKTNYVERITVTDVSLKGWRQENDEDVIIAVLKTRITDYVKDDRTGNVIGGDPSRVKLMEYEWAVTRTAGLKSARATGTRAIECPNCGAPIEINKSAICPYCESFIESSEHDWVVAQIKAISQRTV